MTPLQLLQAERKAMDAKLIARTLVWPLEDVYESLVADEALGLVRVLSWGANHQCSWEAVRAAA